MADVFLMVKNSSEQQNIASIIENSVAFLSDDKLNIYKFKKLEETYDFIRSESKLDFAIVEINSDKDIDFLAEFRVINPNVELMILADSKISPMEYLNPRIRASALLLTPYTKNRLKDVIDDFIAEYYHRITNFSDEKMFVVNTKDGKEYIPFSKVFYIEVREKRVYFRLQNREYSQFGTLENTLKAFPQCFLRCHRSFAFNSKYLSSIKYSENLIFLSHGIQVPLSRSYKKEVKEFLNGIQSW